jgi:hypothetical protein
VELRNICSLCLNFLIRLKKDVVMIMVDYELRRGIETMHIVEIEINKPLISTLINGSHFLRTVCVCSFEKSQTFIT